MTQRARATHREALLEGAIKCLQEKGYARTTARDIVAVSKTNLGSIGYHWGSKEELLDAALNEAFRRWLTPVVETAFAAEDATAFERVRTGFIQVMSSLPERGPLVAAFFEGLAQVERSEAVATRLAELYQELRSQLADLVQDALAGVPRETAEVVASILMALFDGLLVQWRVDPERLPAPEVILQVLEGAVQLAAHSIAVTDELP